MPAAQDEQPKTLKVAAFQSCDAPTFQGTAEKFVKAIRAAAERGARLVVFPEGGLDGSSSRAELEQGLESVRQAARENDVYVVVCTGENVPGHETTDYQNCLYAIGPHGDTLMHYPKLSDGYGRPVPRLASIDGVLASFVICSDRALRPVETLAPALGAQILIECSCNDYDEWREAHQWYLYAPRAVRNSAYTIFCNKRQTRGEGIPHRGHGHTAIISPAGEIMVTAGEEKDKLITAELDLSKATREMLTRRTRHPLFKDWWEMGKAILGGKDFPMVNVQRAVSANNPISCGYGLMPCTSSIDGNVSTIQGQMKKAASADVDLMVFPELAITGAEEADIEKATPESLSKALDSIRQSAREHKMTVAVGAPSIVHGKRRNSAYAIGPDGTVLTRYDQIVVSRPDLFEGGTSTKAMWFQANGVWSILTIGDDALWREMAELASIRGAKIICNLRSKRNATAEAALLDDQVLTDFGTFNTLTVVSNAFYRNADVPDGVHGLGSGIWDAQRWPQGDWCAVNINHGKPRIDVYYTRKMFLGAGGGVDGRTRSRTTPRYSPWYAAGANAMYSEVPGSSAGDSAARANSRLR